MTPVATAEASIGHNNPPSLVNEAVQAMEAAVAPYRDRAEQLVAAADRAAVIDHDTAGKAADLVKMIRVCHTAIEDARKAVKEPYLEAGRKIDAVGKQYTDPLANAKRKVEDKIDVFQREERARLEAERRRMEELRRQQELEAAAAGEAAPEPAPAVAEPQRIEGDLGAKVSTKTEWHHEVLDYRALPESILLSVGVKEAIDKAIKAQIRAGVREISGVRIWSEQKAAVR